MTNDTSESIMLAVQLCIVGAVLGAMVVVLSIGMNIKREAMDYAIKIESAMSEGELQSMEMYTNDSTLPVASVYMALLKNERLVKDITVNGTTYVRESNPSNYNDILNTLRDSFSKTCTIQFNEYRYSGIYDVDMVVNP